MFKKKKKHPELLSNHNKFQTKKKRATDTISTAKNPKKSFAYSFC